MSVMIRLSRKGKTGDPTYRIVAIEKRERRDGKPIDELGLYDPGQDPPFVKIDNLKLEKWQKNGAQLSDSVGRLVKMANKK